MTFRDPDLTQQQEAVSAARKQLSEALNDLSVAAKIASRSVLRGSAEEDLLAVYAATRTVQNAEEVMDLAVLDLDTARGEDA